MLMVDQKQDKKKSLCPMCSITRRTTTSFHQSKAEKKHLPSHLHPPISFVPPSLLSLLFYLWFFSSPFPLAVLFFIVFLFFFPSQDLGKPSISDLSQICQSLTKLFTSCKKLVTSRKF